jgi:hypothetical protein
MSKYSKEYIKEKLQEFTPKELKAFKRLVKEFNYPVDRAFEKIMALKEREKKKVSEQEVPSSSNKKLSEVVGKNEGGQNIIKPVAPEEFELIEIKEENEEKTFDTKLTKEFSEEEIIPVLDPKEIELNSLTKKGREAYENSIKLGKTHEQALQDAYRESKKELIEKLEKLEAFYQPKLD